MSKYWVRRLPCSSLYVLGACPISKVYFTSDYSCKMDDTEVIMQSIVKEDVKEEEKEEEEEEEEEEEVKADNIDDDNSVDEDVKPPLSVFITSDGNYIEEGTFGPINEQDPLQTNDAHSSSLQISPDQVDWRQTNVTDLEDSSKLEDNRLMYDVQKIRQTAQQLRRNSVENRYKCGFCTKSFRQRTNFLNHLRIHTGEKPYTCEECGRGFTERGNLTRHLRTHSGEKPYECTLCEKGFALRDNLIRHMRSHSRRKCYTCDLCGKTFFWETHLDEHKKNECQEKPNPESLQTVSG